MPRAIRGQNPISALPRFDSCKNSRLGRGGLIPAWPRHPCSSGQSVVKNSVDSFRCTEKKYPSHEDRSSEQLAQPRAKGVGQDVVVVAVREALRNHFDLREGEGGE